MTPSAKRVFCVLGIKFYPGESVVKDIFPIRSNAHRAYLIMRNRIVRSEIAAGEKLKIADLAAELGVSPGAMREALSRLTSEHLVVAKDQLGFRVAPISMDELDDLTEVRIEIEVNALRKSMARGSGAWLASVRQSFSDLKYNSEPHDASALAHASFHEALVAECGSPTLLRIRHSLYQSSERYRYFAIQRALSKRNPDEEHRIICEAVLDRDVAAATYALAAHIRTTAVFVKEALEREFGPGTTANAG